ncbi:MAG: hypothetical protein K2X49_05900 [Acetobacteraceae bacterium]|nr:hypothetical protein [Acetobacteraceae bacterium]
MTRASYGMLVVVPVLAGAWTAIREFINGYNAASRRVTRELVEAAASAREGLSKAARAMSDAPQLGELQTRATKSVDRLDAAIAAAHAKMAELGERALVSADLPLPWVVAFFAALAVFVAHTIWQVFAPDIIRSGTLDAHVARRRDAYAKHQIAGELALARSLAQEDEHELVEGIAHSVRTAFVQGGTADALTRLGARAPDVRMLTEGGLAALTEKLSPEQPGKAWITGDLTSLIRAVARTQPAPLANATEALNRDLEWIDRGARAEYRQASERRPILFALSSAFYAIALLLILLLTAQQTWTILHQAALAGPPRNIAAWTGNKPASQPQSGDSR